MLHIKNKRVSVLGTGIHPLTRKKTIHFLGAWIENNILDYISFCTVNDVMEGLRDKSVQQMINRGWTVPDGMPLVWLCRYYGHKSTARIYGPDIMAEFCMYGSTRGYRHFFYGGGPGVAQSLARRFERQFPGIIVAGAYTPKKLDRGEMEESRVIKEINASRPDVIWVGLGGPKQNVWMAKHRHLLNAPVLAGVGAAFDFHSGRLAQAPGWMQENGLEWLFRLLKEPRRLAFRYLVYNPLFIMLIFLQITGIRKFHS